MKFITATAVYSYSGGIELRADSAVMLEVADLARGKMGKHMRVGLNHVETNPAPYDEFLEFLDIEILAEVQYVRIFREGTTLRWCRFGSQIGVRSCNPTLPL